MRGGEGGEEKRLVGVIEEFAPSDQRPPCPARLDYESPPEPPQLPSGAIGRVLAFSGALLRAVRKIEEMSLRLFDDRTRTEASPGRDTESRWGVLDRRAGPE